MVNRENVFESVRALYRDEQEQIMGEYPFCVNDVGGA